MTRNGAFHTNWLFAAAALCLVVFLVACGQRYERDENCVFEDRQASCTWQEIDRYRYVPISREESKSKLQDIEDSAGKVVKVAILVEEGLEFDASETTAFMMATLKDVRGWRGIVGKRFVRVQPEEAEVKVLLTAAHNVDALCAPLRTNGYLSCRSGDRAILNAARWEYAVPHWPTGEIEEYRAYLVNHEVGHFLGKHHRDCSRRGTLAPVMMQQSKYLNGCKANGWPNPNEK